MNKKALRQKAKEHKKEIIIGVVTVTTVAIGSYLVYRNWDSIKTLFRPKSSKNIPTIIPEPIKEIKPHYDTILPKEITDNLTGEKMTAKELGFETYCSAREINKRLVGKGLQVKNIFGEYDITELGEPVGIVTHKTTQYGYSFSNNEWDSAIINYIFSKEELEEIERKHKIFDDILNDYAA